MPQSLLQLYTHLVFSTKLRHPFVPVRSHREHVFKYLAGTCKNLRSPAIRIGGHVDHVHVLCRLGKEATVSTLVRELKRESSKWIKTLDPSLRSFTWQAGYGAFSVSRGHVDALVTYMYTDKTSTTGKRVFRSSSAASARSTKSLQTIGIVGIEVVRCVTPTG
jgi:REP element-mobilizing transposase RayT